VPFGVQASWMLIISWQGGMGLVVLGKQTSLRYCSSVLVDWRAKRALEARAEERKDVMMGMEKCIFEQVAIEGI
jgi:hypothetical protein